MADTLSGLQGPPQAVSKAGSRKYFALNSGKRKNFWRLQAMIALVTLFHYGFETFQFEPSNENIEHIAPTLYVFPIVYAAVHFRQYGSIVTTLWTMLISIPNILFWHQAPISSFFELIQIGTGLFVGLVVARIVERQAADKDRAQELSNRLAAQNVQVTHAREEERRRIARELHDDTIQALVYLCRGIDEIASTPSSPEELKDSLSRLRNHIEQTLTGVRKISQDLRLSILDDLGLVPALEWLTADAAKRANLEVRFELSGNSRRLPLETELALFRVAQESLRNVEKHAKASSAVVEISFAESSVTLSISDDGQGIGIPKSASTLMTEGKLGLLGMEERIELGGGKFDIQSNSASGTRIRATLPG